jgi:hypothetical protein
MKTNGDFWKIGPLVRNLADDEDFTFVFGI